LKALKLTNKNSNKNSVQTVDQQHCQAIHNRTNLTLNLEILCMEPKLFYIENLLNEDECDYIIHLIKNKHIKLTKSKIRSGNTAKNNKNLNAKKISRRTRTTF